MPHVRKLISWSILMTCRILLAGLTTFAVTALTADPADALHCCCTSGYSIGGYSTPTTTIYSGGTGLRTTRSYSTPATGYYYSPSSYHYRTYSPYGFYQPYSRSGITISIGSGYRPGYSYGPGYHPYYGSSRFGYGRSYGYPSRYGFGQRSGFSFGFGSSLGRHSHFHRH
jgi:hypothetical protein